MQSLLNKELDELAAGVIAGTRPADTPERIMALVGKETDSMNALEAEVGMFEQFEHDLLKTEEGAYATDYRWAVSMIVAAALAALPGSPASCGCCVGIWRSSGGKPGTFSADSSM